MKTKYLAYVALSVAALVLPSCVYPAGYSVGASFNSGGQVSAWVDASYDADGFPIYGYSYGRPVYGYTYAGAPIFTISALYAGCYVPNWSPASWCHHHHSYPHGIHRIARPPRYQSGHRPHVRPAMNAPIHRNPSSVLRPAARPSVGGINHGNNRPVLGGMNRPNNSRPVVGGINRPDNNRPNLGNVSRPDNNRPNLGNVGRPDNNRPNLGNVSRPNNNRPNLGNVSRPTVSSPSFSSTSRPTMSRPSSSSVSRPTMSRPSSSSMSRPTMSRPSSSSMSRPSVSRPSSGGMSRPSGGGGGPRRR